MEFSFFWRQNQAVLNSLTELNFQDAFQNGGSAGDGAYVRKGTTWRVMVASRPEVCSWSDGSTTPRNYGYQPIPVALGSIQPVAEISTSWE
jgi:hypothetical protein